MLEVCKYLLHRCLSVNLSIGFLILILIIFSDMCPHPDPEDSIFKTSAIEVMTDPIPELFNVLTEEEDYLKRWTTHKYPVYFEALYSKKLNLKDKGKFRHCAW